MRHLSIGKRNEKGIGMAACQREVVGLGQSLPLWRDHESLCYKITWIIWHLMSILKHKQVFDFFQVDRHLEYYNSSFKAETEMNTKKLK